MISKEKVTKVIFEIAEKIKREYKLEEIILFGSYAFGKSTRDSDNDMLIIKRTKKKKHGSVVHLEKVVQIPTGEFPFLHWFLLPGSVNMVCL